MVNRVQTMRSSVVGNRPVGRQPGELYTNWPELQFGVINSGGTAQDLLAVRFFSASTSYPVGAYVVQGNKLYTAIAAVSAGAFNATQWSLVGGYVTVSDTAPTGPANGQLWYDSVGGQLYVYYQDPTSSQWVIATTFTGPPPATTNPVMDGVAAVGVGTAWARNDHVHPSDTSLVPLSGGTMTGTLVAPNIAAPQAMGDNRVVNGDMRIDQRNGGASGTTNNVYTIDRWIYDGSVASKGTWGQNLNAIVGPVGFPYYFGFQSSSAYAVVAADFFGFSQYIEADMISDFAWGTVNAQPVTLSFWAYSSKTGTFGGSIQNFASTRSYPFSYSIPTANTWTKITITIPGDTAGTWVLSGSAGAIQVNLMFGVGSTRSGSANAWAAANYMSATGAVSVVATNAATFYMTGVKLEIGSIATPFNRQSLAKSMTDCERYYQKIGGSAGVEIIIQGYTPLAASMGITFPYRTQMRAVPTATQVGTTWQINNVQASSLYPGIYCCGISVNTPGAGQTNWYATDSTDYIALSAEL